MSQARVAEILDAYLRALEAGDAPDRAALLTEHADVAKELALALDSLDFIRRAATSLSGDDALEGKALGDYRLVREIGRGGMAVVYEAEQVSLGRRVALKVLPLAAVLDPKQLQRFKNEALAAAHLQHPHIVPVHGVGAERGVHYYAMQFIEGQSLAAAIRSMKGGGAGEGAGSPDGPRTPISSHGSNRETAYIRMATTLGVQAAEALDHAHQLGIVHRDVKPGNLLVDGAGTLFVTDFGLASSVADVSLTMTGEILGTIRYMSPEQALGKRAPVDHRTDVYSLGATLYELFTLEPAFPGEDAHVVIRDIATTEPTPPRKLNPAVPRDLETVILKALSKDPAGRYATAQEMADDLGRCLADKPILARRPSAAARVARWSRRHRGLVAGTLTVLFVGVAALAVGAKREERNTRAAFRRAATNLELARHAVGEFLLATGIKDVEEKPVPSSAQSALLERALGFYENYGEDEASNRDRVVILHALKRFEEAQRVLDGILLRRPDDAWALAWRGHVLWHLERHDDALAVLDRAKGIDAGLWEAPFFRGLVLVSLSRPAEAEAAYREAVGLQPGHVQARLNLGILIWNRGDADGAIEQYREAIRHRPRYANAHNSLGYVLLKRDDVPGAIAAFREAIRIDPELGFAHTNLGLAYRRAGDLPRAIEEHREAIRIRQDHVEAHYNLGLALAASGNRDEAIEEYRTVIRIRPDYVDAHFSLSKELEGKGDLKGAIDSCQEALRLRADHVDAHVILSGQLGKKGDFKGAIAACEAALRIQPDHLGARYNLGLALSLSGDRKGAIREYGEILRLQPEDGDAHNALANVLVDERDIEGALPHYREAVRLMPNNASPHYNLANALLDTGHPDDAIAEYRLAIHIMPEYAEAHCNLGHALLGQGRPAEALLSFRKGHELGSKSPGWPYNSQEWIDFAERMVQLEGRMEQVLSGQERPGTAVERIEFAGLLYTKARHGEAARMYVEAFAEDAALADDLAASHRYAAACSAALAAARGDPEAAGWRGRAIEWLRADLAARRKAATDLARHLGRWKGDADLASVRDRIDELPEAEREPWRRLWAQVDEALAAAPAAAGSAAR